MRVLWVEDDRAIGAAMLQALRDAAYACDWVQDGRSALLALETQRYDLALLDLGLPLRDGIQVLRDIRSRGHNLPIVIVSARDSPQDRIAGLDTGADDYLVKPFDVGEILARMRAVLRRQGGSASPVLASGPLSLDPSTRMARFGEVECLLSTREFALLRALLMRPAVIVSRAELEDQIYGWGEEVQSNAVEFLIHGIRKKLGAKCIKNVRGAGWVVAKD